MTELQVIELMLSSKTENEWNDNCDKVKSAFNGYPDFWFFTIVIGGVLGKTKEMHNW